MFLIVRNVIVERDEIPYRDCQVFAHAVPLCSSSEIVAGQQVHPGQLQYGQDRQPYLVALHVAAL